MPLLLGNSVSGSVLCFLSISFDWEAGTDPGQVTQVPDGGGTSPSGQGPARLSNCKLDKHQRRHNQEALGTGTPLSHFPFVRVRFLGVNMLMSVSNFLEFPATRLSIVTGAGAGTGAGGAARTGGAVGTGLNWNSNDVCRRLISLSA